MSPDMWRERQIFDCEASRIIGLTFNGPEGTTLVERSEADEWKIVLPWEADANAAICEQLIQGIARVVILFYVDDDPPKSLAEYGLDPPGFTLQVSLEDGDTTPVLQIGKERVDQPGTFYVRTLPPERLFGMPKAQTEFFRKSVEDLVAVPVSGTDVSSDASQTTPTLALKGPQRDSASPSE